MVGFEAKSCILQSLGLKNYSVFFEDGVIIILGKNLGLCISNYAINTVNLYFGQLIGIYVLIYLAYSITSTIDHIDVCPDFFHAII